jgi:hypothetical protein
MSIQKNKEQRKKNKGKTKEQSTENKEQMEEGERGKQAVTASGTLHKHFPRTYGVDQIEATLKRP